MKQVNQFDSVPKLRWTSGLCHCCADCTICCQGCWCTSQLVRLNVAKLRTRGAATMPHDCCGIGWGCFQWIPCTAMFLSCRFLAANRKELRHLYNLHPGPCNDCCAHTFCSPCATCQEAREIGRREKRYGKQLVVAQQHGIWLDQGGTNMVMVPPSGPRPVRDPPFCSSLPHQYAPAFAHTTNSTPPAGSTRDANPGPMMKPGAQTMPRYQPSKQAAMNNSIGSDAANPQRPIVGTIVQGIPCPNQNASFPEGMCVSKSNGMMASQPPAAPACSTTAADGRSLLPCGSVTGSQLFCQPQQQEELGATAALRPCPSAPMMDSNVTTSNQMEAATSQRSKSATFYPKIY